MHLRRLRGELALQGADPESALKWVERGMRDDTGASRDGVLPLAVLGLRAATRRRDQGESKPPTEWVQSLFQQARDVADSYGGNPAVEGYRHEIDGYLSRLREEDHPEPWLAAAAAWSRAGNPFNRCLCLYRSIPPLLAQDRRPMAQRHLREALAGARELRAAPLVASATALARRTRLSVPELKLPEATPPGGDLVGLTPREVEVLDGLAGGRTNRQIARRLGISERTVGVHVSNVLQKLGVQNRVAAAAAAHRRGLIRDG